MDGNYTVICRFNAGPEIRFEKPDGSELTLKDFIREVEKQVANVTLRNQIINALKNSEKQGVTHV